MMSWISLVSSFLCLSHIHSQSLYKNLQYGEDSAQVLDVLVPSNNVSKVILLIHGGSWSGGNREEMYGFGIFLSKQYPEYAIATIDYRLGNKDNPGFPKQLIDVDQAIKYLKAKAGREISFALVGVSAGAHISMLYSYALDVNKIVKVVVNVVGPADFTAWEYASNATFNEIIMNFIGPYYYWQNPSLYYFTSPRSWINTTSPKTISFYGDNDPVVPIEQAKLLTSRLEQAGVINQLNIYPGGHADWETQYQEDMRDKIIDFLNKYY